MPNYDYRLDKAVSDKTEKEISDYLTKRHGWKHLRFNNDKKYDLLMKLRSGKIIKVEVKEDFTCKRTGNVGLEFFCRNKPSGISTSEADCYIYKIHRPDKIIYFFVTTKKLKEMITDKKYFRVVSGGDVGSNSMSYLFNFEEFIRNGIVIGEFYGQKN